MPHLRYSEPVSKIQPVHQGMGGVTGANADLPQNLPMYVQSHLSGSGPADSGPAPGHNPNYGSVGNDGKPVRERPLTHKPFNPFKKGKMTNA